MIVIRGFRAIDEPDACHKFLVGHGKVLETINVEVSSNKSTWPDNPDVYVIVAEEVESHRILGGARVHKAGKFEMLPMEEATYYMDGRISGLIQERAKEGTGEICGLWNSREGAMSGIGAVFLTRAAVASAIHLNMTSLFALCAPYTVKMAQEVGYQIETSVGNHGTFYYPKLDLVATAMFLPDLKSLQTATFEERDKIMELRHLPNGRKTEIFRGKEIELYFNLDFKNN